MAAMDPTSAEIRQAQRGSVEAFEAIVSCYSVSIYNLAFRFVYDRHEANDLTQDVFLRLYLNLREYDATRPFRPWLYRLATNVCINATRSRRPKAGLEDAQRLRDGKADAPSADPARQAAAKEEMAAVQQAVSQLPETYRSVVVLRYLRDMRCEDVAETLNVPVGTVKTWLFRAREMLKTRMKHLE